MTAGGKRQGAGRKPAAIKRVTLTIRLPADLIDRLPARGKGKMIDAALREYLRDTHNITIIAASPVWL